MLKFFGKHVLHKLHSTISTRWMHSRNKKAKEFIAKGWNALNEVDRVIDFAEYKDHRLIPLLRTAKENFELALETDNLNTKARYWLAKLHFNYHVPEACQAVGAALLVEAADMGDPDAQFELGRRLRIKNNYVKSDQQAFYYLRKAVDQLQRDALYLFGVVYLTGDCVEKDVSSAMWCFLRASEKGHAGAAIAYGSLLLKGAKAAETLPRFTLVMRKRDYTQSLSKEDRAELASQHFQAAVKAGCNLGLKWLKWLKHTSSPPSQ